MTYYLSGYLNISTESIAFLIPLFSTRKENEVFVQDLNHQDTIIRFLKINTDGFKDFEPADSNLEKSVGDAGHLAFRLEKGTVVSGPVEFIRTRLDELEVKNWAPEMFRIEASIISRDEAQYLSAVDDASRLFGDHRGAIWKTSSIASAKIIFNAKDNLAKNSSDNHIEQIIKWLLENLQSEEWKVIWLQAWNQYEGHSGLYEVAVHWIGESGLDRNEPVRMHPRLLNDVGRVLRRLLIHESPYHVRDYAERWLYSGPDASPRIWLNMWLDVAKLSYGISPYIRHVRNEPIGITHGEDIGSLVDLAFEKLHGYVETYKEAPKAVPISLWTRVWRATRHVRKFDASLALADHALDEFIGSIPFMSHVVVPYIEERAASPRMLLKTREWLYHSLENELDSGKSLGHSVWAHTYLAILKNLPDDTVRMAELGYRWLVDGFPNLNVWLRVWNEVATVSAIHRVPFDRDEVALQWLKRADMKMAIWPIMLRNQFHSSFVTADLIELASRWLMSAPSDHRYYAPIAELLQSHNISLVDIMADAKSN